MKYIKTALGTIVIASLCAAAIYQLKARTKGIVDNE